MAAAKPPSASAATLPPSGQIQLDATFKELCKAIEVTADNAEKYHDVKQARQSLIGYLQSTITDEVVAKKLKSALKSLGKELVPPAAVPPAAVSPAAVDS